MRTVRHYHAKGLLPEPEREAAGYRRYDAKAVVDLIKIRTLVDDERSGEAVAEIDKRLCAEIRRLHDREVPAHARCS